MKVNFNKFIQNGLDIVTGRKTLFKQDIFSHWGIKKKTRVF